MRRAGQGPGSIIGQVGTFDPDRLDLSIEPGDRLTPRLEIGLHA